MFLVSRLSFLLYMSMYNVKVLQVMKNNSLCYAQSGHPCLEMTGT
jgi:hypothetical protein